MKNHLSYPPSYCWFLMVFLPLESMGTHIIGGEINYRCLGNDMYEITLQLFRDCDTGIPYFQNPAHIYVYDINGNPLDTIPMNLQNDDTLTFSSSACSVVPPSACIHTTTYRETRYLPFVVGGYDLVYQICCRNIDIINIVDPTATEAAYHSYISDSALSYCNNAAKFNDWPPFYICHNQPMSYDHSATDLDGDSIVYELCRPFNVFTSFSDHYVTWQFPYNTNNMMGFPLPFAIDPVTGILSGTPTIIGTFVVGICAKEYRFGELISTTRRDFQFIVTPCVTSIVADFGTNIHLCNSSLEVSFDNFSSPQNGPFIWDFGDNSARSTETNPTHSYLDTGLYNVMLIAAQGYPCVDTIYKEIHLLVDVADVVLENSPIICREGRVLVVARNLYSNFNDIINYQWSPPSSIISGQGTDSVWVYVSDASFAVIVVVENNFGCSDDELMTQIDMPVDLVEAAFDTLTFSCNTSLTIPFVNTSTASNNQYLWTFDNLATSTAVNPSYTFPDTGTYIIGLIAGVGQYCQDTVIKEIYIPQSGVAIKASDNQVACSGDTLLLVATDLIQGNFEIVDYNWSPINNILSGQGTDSIWVLANQDLYFTLMVSNAENCKDTAYSDVNVSSVSPIVNLLGVPDKIYVGQTSQLFTHYDPNYNYDWIAEPTLSDSTINNPSAKPRVTTTYYLTVSSPQGCFLLDTVTIQILPSICDNPLVFVPSAFTPDGDGYNDVLMVNGNNITEMTMMIYNRWGQKVFESNDQSIGWDGTYKGQIQPTDVYGYYMKCACEEGGDLLLKGNITLLR